MIKTRIKQFSFFFVAIFFVFILSIFFYDVIFLGKTFKVTTMYAQAFPSGPYGQGRNYGAFVPMTFTDSAPLEEPFLQFLKVNFHNGVLPLWNPYQFCGVSTSAMLESGVFFPLNFLVYLLPNSVSWDTLIFARILAAGLFMYWLMSIWNFGFWSRVVASFGFMLTGPMVVSQLWTVNVDLLLPFLFLSVYKVYFQPCRSNYLLFGLAIGLSLFAGHIEHVFLTHFLTALYVLFLFWQNRSRKASEHRQSALNFLKFYFLGLGLSAVVFLPFLMDFSRFWNPHTVGTGSIILEPKKNIITMLVPYFFQPGLLSLHDERFSWSGGYLGGIVITLAISGIWPKRQRALSWLLACMAVFCFGKMFGFAYAQWIGYLPVFRDILLTWHLFHILAFLIAILAGFGIEELARDPRKAWLRTALIAITLMIFIGAHLWIYQKENFFPQALRSSLVTAGFLGGLILWIFFVGLIKTNNLRHWMSAGALMLMILELFIYNPRCRIDRLNSFPPVPYINALKEEGRHFVFRVQGLFWTLYKNTPMAYGLDAFSGHQSLHPIRYVRFVKSLLNPDAYLKMGEKPATGKDLDDSMVANSDLLAMANVKYFIIPQFSFGQKVKIIPTSFVAPRAYLAFDWILKNNNQEEEILNLIRTERSRLVSRIVVEVDLNDPVRKVLPRATDGVIANAIITKKWVNGVTIKAKNDTPCFLVLLDSYDPGWRAWVDGKPARICPANYLFRAVFLMPGDHTVEFLFVPFWFYVGLFVSVVSFGIFFVYLLKKPKR